MTETRLLPTSVLRTLNASGIYSLESISTGMSIGAYSRGAFEFDISAIPSAAVIHSVRFRYYQGSGSDLLGRGRVGQLTVQPSSLSLTSATDAYSLYLQAGSSVTYVYPNWSDSPPTEHIDLLSGAEDDLQAAMSAGQTWFGVFVNAMQEVGNTTLYNELDDDIGNIVGDAIPSTAYLAVFWSAADSSSRLNLDMRYTTAAYNTAQNTPANSLGGHPSTNSIYESSDIAERVDITQTSIEVVTLPDDRSGLAQIGPEILRYASVDTQTNSIDNITRGISPPFAFPSGLNPHPDVMHYLSVDNLFHRRPTKDMVQYRCIAIANREDSKTIDNIVIYLRQHYNSDVQVDAGIEVPSHDRWTSTVTTGGSMTVFVDNNLAGLFENDHFTASSIEITSGTNTGQIRSVLSFDGNTGTFVLDLDLSNNLTVGDNYRVNPAPSQTVAAGAVKPLENSGYFFGFMQEGGSASLDYGSVRENGGTLRPYDVFYIWIKRTLIANVKAKSDTGAIIGIRYTDAGS